ncbi:putative Serine-threonine protein kinase, plant-type [Hibiscus syriacus]|uniref:Serine-threonine protein kinase, plant-type n=2 Tax=Hibiscus syriacus TaxID=106335 RepID=A0A6A2ZWT5_HIBSY|nr:putative Serine-threonine protein kinase, plant-type [Hibiscus syriacus]
MPSSSPMEPEKYINYQKAKDTSLLAIAFSIVIYISICYDIFNLSSSTLLSNTKFWFLISNTLILIIAADYGAFSASKHRKPDLYEEYRYALRCQARRSSAEYPSFVSQQCHMNNIPMEEKIVADHHHHYHHHRKMDETPEKILEVVRISEPEKPETIRRSKSRRAKHVTFNDVNNNDKNNCNLQRSNTEKHEPNIKVHESPAEANEFSTMSDEELNRRVEEFIEKFNRQIKVQANAC